MHAPCSRALALAAFAVVASAASGQRFSPDPLLSIDQNRASIVDRIVRQWGDTVAASRESVDQLQLREMLNGLRADVLLAASLAGSADGLREIIGPSMSPAQAPQDGKVHAKSVGDFGDDVTYTPVTPCRFVDTRGAFSPVYAGGPFASSEIRTYTVRGGNGACLSQLPSGLNPAAVQLQVFGMPTTAASGDIEILPQGAAFGSTATMVYVASIAFNTVSANARINLANNQISVQVRGGGANLAIDVVGYFKRPSNFGNNTVTPANGNTALGNLALNANTSGFNNTAVGVSALAVNTSGFANTGTGQTALSKNTFGYHNTGHGTWALRFNVGGNSNTAVGSEVLASNTSGVENTAVGTYALVFNDTGSDNIAIGNSAGYNNSPGASNNIEIGNVGTSGDSGIIRIGTAGEQIAFFAAGIRGVTTNLPGGAYVLVDANGQLGTASSSRRFKEDIEDMGDASTALLQLRPVTFRYTKPYADGSKPLDYGLIAEEVADVYPDLVARSADGQIETVQYHKLAPMLLNEVQKQQAIIRSLEDRLARLEGLLAIHAR